MQILTKNNQKFEKPSRNLSYRTEVKILKKKDFLIAHQKRLVPRMLSHREIDILANKRKKRIKIFF
jgi:hypothetical protein